MKQKVLKYLELVVLTMEMKQVGESIIRIEAQRPSKGSTVPLAFKGYVKKYNY